MIDAVMRLMQDPGPLGSAVCALSAAVEDGAEVGIMPDEAFAILAALARLEQSERDAEIWRGLMSLAERFPHVSISHGDGSESASGWLGWEIEVVTGIPFGAVIEDDHETADAALRAATDAADAEVRQWKAKLNAPTTPPERGRPSGEAA